MTEQKRRVVVTGLGVVSPVGHTLDETWNNLINGVHGIAPITLFDTTDYKAKLAAEVKDFNPRDYMEKQEILRSDRFSQLAIAAASQAVEESGIMGTVAPERFAVYFGTGIGGVTTITKEHRKLFDKGAGACVPLSCTDDDCKHGGWNDCYSLQLPRCCNACRNCMCIRCQCLGEAVRAIVTDMPMR